MEVAESIPPKVFISYSHDSREHEDRVLSLADRLRADGIDARIDQYEPAPPDGWPIWMNAEIRKADFVLMVCTEIYRRRAERGEEPGKGRGVLWEAKLVFNDLYLNDSLVQKYIPILLDGASADDIPAPLETLAHYSIDTDAGYDDLYRHLTSQPLHPKPALGKLKSLPAKEPQSYPSSLAAKPDTKKPTSLDQRNRQRFIKQVRLDWIEGVLEQSLYKVARMELGLVEHPLNTTIRIPEREPRAIPPGIPISQVFDEQAGAMLILGAPGTGKTTLLLELARDLLLRSENDESQPMPAVFNLSSWAIRRRPLREWLIAELNERNQVPKKVAARWMDSEQMLPLLDGLDEVAAEHREACVEAINHFRREYGLLPIAVCCRIADYEALGTKLRLRAIEVQPLTRSQVEDYLERVGGPLDVLRAEAENDPSYWELLETPLMLWVAMLAYRDVPPAFTLNASLEQRRRQLLGHFVEAMFRRGAGKRGYKTEQVTRWLSWLACALRRKKQTVFYLEGLDFDWMPAGAKRWLARGGVIVAIGVIGGLIFGVVGGLIFGLSNGLIFGLRTGLRFGLMGGLIGLIGGLSGVVLKIRPVEKVRVRWTDISSRKSAALRDGLIFVLISVLIGGLSELLRGGLHYGLSNGLIGGLMFGLTGGPFFGLTRLFTSEALPETRSAVNEGTYRSIRIAVLSLLSFGLIGGLIGGMIGGLLGVLVGVLVGGPIIGLIVGLTSGGMFALKHFVVRLFFWTSGFAPLDYPAFLAQAKELLFLRRVGGGYIFVHRLLQEYFYSSTITRTPDPSGPPR